LHDGITKGSNFVYKLLSKLHKLYTCEHNNTRAQILVDKKPILKCYQPNTNTQVEHIIVAHKNEYSSAEHK
jgi:hypothetical protein